MTLYQKEALSIDVATRLHELRDERRMSMRTLASRSGLSANALSMIERGKSSPSVSTLYKLAEALGVPITAFFGPQTNRSQVVFIKADERKRVPFQRGVWEGLGGEQFSGRVEPFMITLESGASSGLHDIMHTGHEFVFCLRGNLEYQVENQVFDLKAGDSLLFLANLRHRWRNTGNTVTNVLIILSDFSEGEQPVALHLTKESAN
jgi:transcriptional regulator with XRE-family HTH domain